MISFIQPLQEYENITEIHVHHGVTVTIAEVTIGDLLFTGEAKLHPKDEKYGLANRRIGEYLAIARAFEIAGDHLQQEAQQMVDFNNDIQNDMALLGLRDDGILGMKDHPELRDDGTG